MGGMKSYPLSRTGRPVGCTQYSGGAALRSPLFPATCSLTKSYRRALASVRL